MSVNPVECLICGESSTMAAEYMLIDERAQVCHHCAEIVANTFSMKHSGRWLTRPQDSLAASTLRRKKIPHAVRQHVMERDAYRCAECGSWHDLTLDHIVPYSKGGSDEPANLRAMCRQCNSRRGAKE